MSSPASSPPLRLISDELWALISRWPAAAACGARPQWPPAGLRSGRPGGYRLLTNRGARQCRRQDRSQQDLGSGRRSL